MLREGNNLGYFYKKNYRRRRKKKEELEKGDCVDPVINLSGAS